MKLRKNTYSRPKSIAAKNNKYDRVFHFGGHDMKRSKTSQIVVYTILEDTIHGLLWVYNRFRCAPSCPIAYTLLSQVEGELC